jgi:hypothetical protein
MRTSIERYGMKSLQPTKNTFFLNALTVDSDQPHDATRRPVSGHSMRNAYIASKRIV